MKVVVENVRKFICVIIRKILCLENFPFPFQFQSGTRLLLSSTISEEASVTRYFGTIETC